MTYLQIAIEGLNTLGLTAEDDSERKLLATIKWMVEESHKMYEPEEYAKAKEEHEQFMADELERERAQDDEDARQEAHEDFYLEQTALAQNYN